ncbi:GntR family transcriptional regulator [Celeribacter sp.]|uniref:GntR family transcriptional regulator n=1 Tax=Celeribacter sp. TaxID=1890673 RepID=UPI003A94AFCE
MTLSSLNPPPAPSVTDMVFKALYDRIVSLELPPGTKLSEADVAAKLGVSRQPVRDAFYRLSQQGFLLIRPQRATTVRPISAKAVFRARFIRTALEVEIMRTVLEVITDEDLARLAANMDAQKKAVDEDDRETFHALDDAFHRELCVIAGEPEVWQLIRDNKAHMDRVRFLSLGQGAQFAYDEHIEIFNAIRSGDPDTAISEIRSHLMRIGKTIHQIRADHAEYFEDED